MATQENDEKSARITNLQAMILTHCFLNIK
jgi:hypothetical protein